MLIMTLSLTALIYANILRDQRNNNRNLFTLDVYGTNQLPADLLESKYKNQFNEMAEIFNSPSGLTSSENQEHFSAIMKNMMADINSLNKFSYVGITPIIYPGDKILHITIDIVEKNDNARLIHFIPKQRETVGDPDHLIEQWIKYEKMGFSIFYKDKVCPTYKKCPAYHCLFGFDHKLLKKYLIIFDKNVEKDKLKLMNVLRNDYDENKRAAAAFLLAHIKNANEMIKILTPSLYDSSKSVRNNVMRVIGITLDNHPEIDFPIATVCDILDFPETTDRNKAMLIIRSLAKHDKNKKYIIQHCGSLLISELKLNQPNDHILSYQILQIISKETYSDLDIKSWEKWVKAHQ